MPAPAAASLALLPLILGLQFGGSFFSNPAVTGITLAGVSALMVSRIPTFAFKQVRVPGRYVVFVLLAVGALIAFLISEPWATLGLLCSVYLLSIPYASLVFRRHARESGLQVVGHKDEKDRDAAE